MNAAISEHRPRKLILMRGASGSGKSTLAQSILNNEEHGEGVIYSTDEYFFRPPPSDSPSPSLSSLSDTAPPPQDPPPSHLTLVQKEQQGWIYTFHASHLSHAHAWNQSRAHKSMQESAHRVIIIDNTHIQLWEMKAYIVSCLETKFAEREHIYFREPETSWWVKRDVEAMANGNGHGVGLEALRRMVERWEGLTPGREVEEVLQAEKPAMMSTGGRGGGYGRGRGGYFDRGGSSLRGGWGGGDRRGYGGRGGWSQSQERNDGNMGGWRECYGDNPEGGAWRQQRHDNAQGGEPGRYESSGRNERGGGWRRTDG
ncbi:hypothetical protein HDV05_000902 [Chytridiales sp. JEL 0842]|nr:hypothetical protein HDV05_000902 [Chytridiales sp. JEL 0842]